MFTIEERLNHAATVARVLREWDGCTWRLTGYSMAHPTFSIWLFGEARRGAIRLYCYLPTHYCGPTGGDRAHFRVTVREDDPRVQFLVREQSAALLIECDGIGVKDAERPHWLPWQDGGGARGASV